MYKIEITAETLVELTGKVTTLAAKLNTGSATEAPPKTIEVEVEKPKAKTARKKDSPEQAEVGNAAPSAEAVSSTSNSEQDTPSVEPAKSPSEDEPALDFDKDVAPVVIDTVGRVGREAVSSTLAEFNAERASEVDPAQYAELVTALKGL